ncbi:hypothetical protein DNTS_001094 [Danionella cerebrum]|uniref:CCDC66 domain-containing protein n=1 Tax=Danionella cerebrum TaxID=2873325 RepID=A0A553RFE7_9TELE|nr:hypothetical protein DNTS_001094 [Danionella translucida]
MDLGDGLLFDLDNGKPRLVLAKYGSEPNASKKKGSCGILSRKITLNSKPELSHKTEHGQKSKTSPAIISHEQNISDKPKRTYSKSKVQPESTKMEPVRENVVCLTQEQFQQILSSINSRSVPSEETGPEQTTASEEFIHNECNSKKETEEYRHKESLPAEQQFDFFSTFGERERERGKLEDKKAQWRKELESCEVRLKDSSDSGRSSEQTTEGRENQKQRVPAQTQRELPAAMLSAFRVGDAAPVEEIFHAQRAEQQRRWLQELNLQIEETKLRRQHDRELDRQTEDMECWTSHFDSLHAARTERGLPDTNSSLSQRHPASTANSTNVCEQANSDSTQGIKQRSSFLRTMTALLDPAQIEERERRRLKQLEHQQAIEEQVEQRRHQKEKDEASRRAQELEEEQRIEREREQLHQQFRKDTEQQKHREEVISRKTEQLYQSIQKAEEEAFKDKHLQRIRDLAKKGHDVSKLLQSMNGVLGGLGSDDSPATTEIFEMGQSQRLEPRRDTAVQTDNFLQLGNASDSVRGAGGTDTAPPKDWKSHSAELKESELNRARKLIHSGTEHYEAYARTTRKQKSERKPEWNTQKPRKAFVPASARYPEALQRFRQESRRQRQMELMAMAQRNAPTPPFPVNDPIVQPQRLKKTSPQQAVNHLQKASGSCTKIRKSPPVPALQNHVHQSAQQFEGSPQPLVPDHVSKDEVYHTDALAPLSRASSCGVGTAAVNNIRQTTSLLQPDPEGLKLTTERQQAILKGLSQLRQGLLQRQRELETSLKPVQEIQAGKYFSTFRLV